MNYNIRMKMKFFVKSVLCLVMLTSLCCSCSDDSESWEELDAPTGEVLPKTDQLSVKLNLPTAVLGNNFKEAGSALVNRVDTITLTGSSGTANITVDGVTKMVEIAETYDYTKEWSTRSGGELQTLGQLKADELKLQFSRSKQFIQMEIQEKGQISRF